MASQSPRRIHFPAGAGVGNPKANLAWALRTLQFELDGRGTSDEEEEAVRWNTAARLLGIT